MNAHKETAERGRDTSTSGCVQGTIFPPEFKPRSRRTSVTTSVKAPRKSTLESFDFSDFLGGISTTKNTSIPLRTTSGTCDKNAVLHPHVSFTQPPKSPPSPAPDPKHTFPIPCINPRLRSGTRSDPTNVLIAIKPPPPMPATTLPAIIAHSLFARPQSRFPAANNTLLTTSPVRLLKISVRRPDMGWHAEFAIRYADASQERRESELKEVEMGAESVAIIVLSSAPRKTPIQMLARVMKSLRFEGSSGMMVSSVDCGSPSSELTGGWDVSRRRGVCSSGDEDVGFAPFVLELLSKAIVNMSIKSSRKKNKKLHSSLRCFSLLKSGI